MELRIGSAEFDALASIGVFVGFCEFDCSSPEASSELAPIRGGDDVPREEDERIEIWEPRKKEPKRDQSLDKAVREAYAKATGKPIAAAVANPGPSVRSPAPFDQDEDDFEVFILSY